MRLLSTLVTVLLIAVSTLSAQAKDMSPSEVVQAYNNQIQYANRIFDLWPYTAKPVVDRQKAWTPAHRRKELAELKTEYVSKLKITKVEINGDIALIRYEGVGGGPKESDLYNAFGIAKLAKLNGRWKVIKFNVNCPETT